MYTRGPATSLETSESVFLQNEQRNFGIPLPLSPGDTFGVDAVAPAWGAPLALASERFTGYARTVC
ncbi:MAG: hypothetical protein JWM87_3375 [Candidatus Eremiobacteraeota bacterium]|nr:hypothetical protein [Candidatus Eremiobacteraeota bacterium]